MERCSPLLPNSNDNAAGCSGLLMLGVRTDAEDIVEDAYLRWHGADVGEIRSPEAWLTTVTTRLCIDRPRSAALERRRYAGPWLPEPLVAAPPPSPEDQLELSSSLSVAFLAIRERLSSEERAGSVLRAAFDCPYPEIPRILGKGEAACRQMIHRARGRVRSEQPRFEVDPRATGNGCSVSAAIPVVKRCQGARDATTN